MEKAREFDNILDECLERILVNGETIEQCLAGYPEYAAELEPLLRTALVAREASAIKPRPEFRERASYQFQAAIHGARAQKGRGFFGWQPRWVTAVIVVVVLLLAGSGTVVAAGNSLPDEPLYPVKLATEAVRLAFTPSDLGKAELYVKLADERVAEIIELADEGKVEQVEKTAQRLNTHLVAVADLAVPGGEELVAGGEATFEAGQSVTAVEVAPQEPETVVVEAAQEPVTEAPPAAVKQPEPTLAPTPAPTPVPAPTPIPAPAPAQVEKIQPPEEKAPVITIPQAPEQPEDSAVTDRNGSVEEEGIKPDGQSELRTLLSRRAVENQDALRAVLETAPESVKPALEEAIKLADASYEEALRRLD
jgi:hypothetical protein